MWENRLFANVYISIQIVNEVYSVEGKRLTTIFLLTADSIFLLKRKVILSLIVSLSSKYSYYFDILKSSYRTKLNLFKSGFWKVNHYLQQNIYWLNRLMFF